MKETLFRTDGIRGKAYEYLNSELAYNFGKAVAEVALKNNIDKPKVVIGKDTRESGEMLEKAVVGALTDYGVDVIKIGTIPTGAVSFLTKKLLANNGIMITASHNPAEYNGLKLFNGNGFKITDLQAKQIEQLILKAEEKPESSTKGCVTENKGALELYEDYVLSLGHNVKGLKIGLDCANGASEKIASDVFNKLGAKLFITKNKSNGNNINEDCGSNNPENIRKFVLQNNLDIGFAFDGDADRIIAVNKEGCILDGDDILYILANNLKQENKLFNNVIIGTSMSNLGLERALNNEGFDFKRASVGDKNVVNKMLMNNASLGGESCGHIIFAGELFTSDAVCTAVSISSILGKYGSLNCDYNKYESKFINISACEKYKDEYMNIPEIKTEIDDLKNKLASKGRLVVRASGTTPVIRVKMDVENIKEFEDEFEDLIKVIEKYKNI